jgi:molybdopterin-synthase adenylyltransferase
LPAFSPFSSLNSPPRFQEDTAIANLSPAEITRYARQMDLEGWGREAQERVKASRVLIAGVGGLGSTAALYLLATGVGTIRLVDNSRVSLTDLSHQVLFREQDLGKAKATAAERRLKELNSFTLVEAMVKAISPHNISCLTAGCQVLIDATNNPALGPLLNQAAGKLHIPLVHAAVWDLDGRVTTIWPGRGPCLVCSCQDTRHSGRPSFLSPLAGILGALLALETLRILGGLAPTLLGRVLCFRGATLQFTEKSMSPNPQCPSCQSLPLKRVINRPQV